jgi:gamma-glutamylcyclotransferase (GGCT)/AIG2-like uncharacterized protein YtfP
MYLFVYGTLRRGFRHPAARQLHRRGKFIGTATVRGNVQPMGAYKGLTPGRGRVRGEVFHVGTELLRYLDRFEGEEFRRKLVPAQMDQGGNVQVWVYLLRYRPG